MRISEHAEVARGDVLHQPREILHQDSAHKVR